MHTIKRYGAKCFHCKKITRWILDKEISFVVVVSPCQGKFGVVIFIFRKSVTHHWLFNSFFCIPVLFCLIICQKYDIIQRIICYFKKQVMKCIKLFTENTVQGISARLLVKKTLSKLLKIRLLTIIFLTLTFSPGHEEREKHPAPKYSQRR